MTDTNIEDSYRQTMNFRNDFGINPKFQIKIILDNVNLEMSSFSKYTIDLRHSERITNELKLLMSMLLKPDTIKDLPEFMAKGKPNTVALKEFHKHIFLTYKNIIQYIQEKGWWHIEEVTEEF